MTIGAGVIVTSNLKDFQALPHGLTARSPDELLSQLLSEAPALTVDVLRRQAAGYGRPALPPAELARRLERVAPRFAAAVLAALSAS